MVARRMCTLHEAQTIYGVDAIYDMDEVIAWLDLCEEEATREATKK